MSRYSKPSDKQRERVENIKMGDLADDVALVLITFLSFKPEIQTVNGPSDAIAADLLVITGPHAGSFEEDRLIFNAGIVGKFEDATKGDEMLARTTWAKSKNGRDYVTLTDPDPEDERLADKALKNAKRASEQPV